MQLITDRSAISTEKDVAVDVLIRVVPEIPGGQAERPPLNLALVLDRSGSMAGEKMRLTRQAASRAVESLLEGDRLSIVSRGFPSYTVARAAAIREDATDVAGAQALLSLPSLGASWRRALTSRVPAPPAS